MAFVPSPLSISRFPLSQSPLHPCPRHLNKRHPTFRPSCYRYPLICNADANRRTGREFSSEDPREGTPRIPHIRTTDNVRSPRSQPQYQSTAESNPTTRAPERQQHKSTANTTNTNDPNTASTTTFPETFNDDELCNGEFLYSQSLQDYVEQRRAGQIPSFTSTPYSEWSDCWALSVDEQKGFEMKNQYSRVRILIERNFSDFVPAEGCNDGYQNATLEEIALLKARTVYQVTGLPCIAEVSDMSIDAPESGSRINKSLQQGYYTRRIAEEADAMIDRVRPISDENRLTRFTSSAVYYDGENEIVATKRVNVAMVFSSSTKAIIATTAALDEIFKELSRRFGFSIGSPSSDNAQGEESSETVRGKVLVGAALLRERIVREGKVLGDGIIKVSSFVNHMVDTDLMEVCGEELAERLRRTMPNKVLTVESTGLIAAMPTARKLGIPLVFARKTRPITISDSYQTTYRSATKGTTHELIVSCEYLESGDRVLIIDDFLAGGSTAEGLFKLAKMAHAKVVGVGVLIEKLSDGGRAFLSGYDVPVESLAKVSVDSGGRIAVEEEEPWQSPQSGKKMDGKKLRQKMVRAQAEYYSRTGEGVGAMSEEALTELTALDAEGDGVRSGADDGSGEVSVIRWQDDTLDDIEEDLIREGGGRQR